MWRKSHHTLCLRESVTQKRVWLGTWQPCHDGTERVLSQDDSLDAESMHTNTRMCGAILFPCWDPFLLPQSVRVCGGSTYLCELFIFPPFLEQKNH